MAQTQSNLKQPMNPTLNIGVSHSRSLSQPTFFANNCLPPLSPFPPSESSIISSNSNLKGASMDELDVSSRGPSMPPSFPFRASDSLPPRRAHRRSNSDVPLGFTAMIQSSPQLVPISGQQVVGNDKPAELKMREVKKVSYVKSEGEVVDDLVNSLMNLDHVDAFNASGPEDKSAMSGGGSGNFKSVSVVSLREGVKRSATGDIVPPARHYRSLSMDSGIGKFCLGDESMNFQTPNRVDQLSPSSSISEKIAKLNLEFGPGEFNDVELKKIMSDERLAEIAAADPKRAKRILANRQSAARSKERKVRYISELEHKVQTLQMEATTLSAQVTILQKEYAELTNQNNELKFRVHAMEQQAHIRDALHETLTAEVQHLKLRDERRIPNGMGPQAPMRHHMGPMHRQQPNQMQRMSVSSSSTTSTTTSAQ